MMIRLGLSSCSRTAVAAALAALLSSCGGDDSGPPVPEPLQPRLADLVDCADDARLLCGFLQVPLDHANPAGESLRLAVRLSRNQEAPRGVVGLLAGGPGQPGRFMMPFFLDYMPPAVLDAYRWVTLDTRGTGDAAIDCPALQEAVGSSDIVPGPPGAVAECAAGIGELRSFLATSDTVADLDWLRQALNLETWGLNGVSYGTYVASAYAMTHPSRVSKLILDSPVTHTGFDPLLQNSFQAVPAALAGACASIECPDDLLDTLARAVAEEDDPVMLFNALVAMSVVAPTSTRVPRALIAFKEGDREPLRELVRMGLEIVAEPDSRSFSMGSHLGTVCQDFRMPWGDSTTPLEQREEALEAALDTIGDAGFWPFNRQTARRLAFVHDCSRWPVVPASTEPRTGLLPNIPILILAGALDLSTPLSEAEHQLELAPGGRLLVFGDLGHSVQSYDEGNASVANFLCGEPYDYPVAAEARFERC